MPAYKAMPKDKDPLVNLIGLLAYNAFLIGAVVSLLWFVFPHFGVWRFVALVTVARVIIHGHVTPQPPVDE